MKPNCYFKCSYFLWQILKYLYLIKLIIQLLILYTQMKFHSIWLFCFFLIRIRTQVVISSVFNSSRTFATSCFYLEKITLPPIFWLVRNQHGNWILNLFEAMCCFWIIKWIIFFYKCFALLVKIVRFLGISPSMKADWVWHLQTSALTLANNDEHICPFSSYEPNR